jgi:glycosyltransferase involved in cell wall biosynthesis
MLTIVAKYPSKKNERDGMIRRIQAIDDNFSDIDRIYLDISLAKNIRARKNTHDNVTIYQLNMFLHFLYILYLCFLSNVIYVHSIYNSMSILPVYLFHSHIITDMHGVVVEEIKMNKKHNRFYVFLGVIVFIFIEYIVVKHSWSIICVSENMKKYFAKKYSINDKKIIVIPIFNIIKKVSNVNSGNKIHNPIRILYSGGMQPWQCVDYMMNVIADTVDLYDWTILSGDLEEFQKKIFEFNLEGKVKLKSVLPNDIGKYYFQNDFGIVLREDNIVNHVACPTKLIEYLQYYLLPVVLSAKIGDFRELNYEYVYVNDVVNDNINNISETYAFSINKNRKIIEGIISIANDNLKILQDVVGSKMK